MRFLRTIQKPDHPLESLDERASLIESGLIDSLAVLEIVSYLEDDLWDRVRREGRGSGSG